MQNTIESTNPFNDLKTYQVSPINNNKFKIVQLVAGFKSSETTADIYRTSELAYIEQSDLADLARKKEIKRFYSKSGKLMYFYIKQIKNTNDIYAIYSKTFPKGEGKNIYISRLIKEGKGELNKKRIEEIALFAISNDEVDLEFKNKLISDITVNFFNQLNFLNFNSGL